MSRGRPMLGVGELGQVSYTEEHGKIIAVARTRDTSGNLRKLRVVASTADEAHGKLAQKAADLRLAQGQLATGSTLGELLDTWYEQMVSKRNIRDQSKRMYRTKANKLIAHPDS